MRRFPSDPAEPVTSSLGAQARPSPACLRLDWLQFEAWELGGQSDATD